MSLNSKAKGAAGERELCKWIDKHLQLPREASRNLEQVRSGGSDIVIEPFSFEVKRVENLDVKAAWIQCRRDAEAINLEPVLAHRRNRQPWTFCISAKHIGCGLGFVSLDEKTFKLWAENAWSGQEA